MKTPVLEGHGIRLEPIAERHIVQLQANATEPSIWRYMPLVLQNEHDVRIWAEEAIRLDGTESFHVWVVCLANGTVVGSTRLYDLHPVHRTCEIGFSWLDKQYRGKGINPRAKLLQLTYAFENLGLFRVALKTHHDNLQSQAAMLKLGATYEGTFRNHMQMPDGSTRHTAWYSIIAEEWPAVKTGLLERLDTEPINLPNQS